MAGIGRSFIDINQIFLLLLLFVVVVAVVVIVCCCFFFVVVDVVDVTNVCDT